MNWEVLLNLFSKYAWLLSVILATVDAILLYLNKQDSNKNYGLPILIITILIIAISIFTTYSNNQEYKKLLLTSQTTLSNTTNIISEAKNLNNLLKENIELSQKLSNSTLDINDKTIEIFNNLTDKDSYCYIDVKTFMLPPLKDQKVLSFQLKHVGDYPLENVNMSIQDTKRAFCLKTFNKANKWIEIDDLTTINKFFFIIHPNTTIPIEIPIDTSTLYPEGVNFVGGVDITTDLCNKDKVSLVIDIWLTNKTITQVINIDNYTNPQERKISIKVMHKGKLLREINY
jgi:hypothetical protein